MRIGNVTVSGAMKKFPLGLIQTSRMATKFCYATALRSPKPTIHDYQLRKPCAWRFQVN